MGVFTNQHGLSNTNMAINVEVAAGLKYALLKGMKEAVHPIGVQQLDLFGLQRWWTVPLQPQDVKISRCPSKDPSPIKPDWGVINFHQRIGLREHLESKPETSENYC